MICHVKGGFHAIENRCSHLKKPLTGGRLIGTEISCPFHAAVFDVVTGEAKAFPANKPLKCFETRLVGSIIEVATDPRAPLR